MNVIFCFQNTKEEFEALPGVSSLLEKLDRTGDLWVYLEYSLMSQEEIQVRLKSVLENRDSVVVTDACALSKTLNMQHVCCVGFQMPGDSSYFSGAEAVFTSFEDLEPEFLLQLHHHFYRIPIVIGITERLIIRESIAEDFEPLYRIAREPGNDRYTETMDKDCSLARDQFNAYLANVYSFYSFGLWTILEKESGKVVGRCGFSVTENREDGDNRMELGYLIGQEFQGKGYAKEACRTALEYLCRTVEPDAVYAVIHKDNIASLCVAKWLGFCFEKEENEKQLLFKYAGQDLR